MNLINQSNVFNAETNKNNKQKQQQKTTIKTNIKLLN